MLWLVKKIAFSTGFQEPWNHFLWHISRNHDVPVNKAKQIEQSKKEKTFCHSFLSANISWRNNEYSIVEKESFWIGLLFSSAINCFFLFPSYKQNKVWMVLIVKQILKNKKHTFSWLEHLTLTTRKQRWIILSEKMNFKKKQRVTTSQRTPNVDSISSPKEVTSLLRLDVTSLNTL